MIVGATMVVVAMAFYAITLSRLYSIGEARQGRAERALPDLLSGGMRDVQSEVRNRARRRRALMFESSDDVQIESARRDVLAALAVALSEIERDAVRRPRELILQVPIAERDLPVTIGPHASLSAFGRWHPSGGTAGGPPTGISRPGRRARVAHPLSSQGS